MGKKHTCWYAASCSAHSENGRVSDVRQVQTRYEGWDVLEATTLYERSMSKFKKWLSRGVSWCSRCCSGFTEPIGRSIGRSCCEVPMGVERCMK